jgi:hypothetical protein
VPNEIPNLVAQTRLRAVEVARDWSFLNKPQDDNIYAPSLKEYTSKFEAVMDKFNFVGIGDLADVLGIIDDDRTYYVWRQTSWDVFKEMELRHPGYVAYPVPYKDRYTMFFGPPDHFYWHRPLTEEERAGMVLTQDMLDTYISISRVENLPGKMGEGLLNVKKMKEVANTVSGGKYNRYLNWMARVRHSRFKSFRNYHFLSSKHNIIANNMSASSYGTFNAVSLTYLEDTHKKSTGEVTLNNEIAAQKEEMDAVEDEGAVFEMKADDNIEDRDLRVMSAVHTGCFGEYFARRYAVSHLLRSLRDVYKGDITIFGDATIKPYDVCYLFDDYRDMYGPVEVGRVTHIVSQETGWITQIKPDLVLHHNDFTTQTTLSAMGAVATEAFGSVADATGVAGAGAAVTAGVAAAIAIPIAGLLVGGIGLALMAFGGYKLTTWSQARQPIFITPVIYKGKPYIAGLNGFKRDSLIMNIQGKWKHLKENMSEGWDDFYQRSPVSSWLKENIAGLIGSSGDEEGGD